MAAGDLVAFLLLVAAGAYVQAVTGFAMALVGMALVTAFDLLPIAQSAAVMALLTATMSLLFLVGEWRRVPWRFLAPLLLCNAPGVLCGLALLAWLDSRDAEWLRLAFGAFVAAAGLSFALRPTRRRALPPAWQTGFAGAVGGVCAGLFAVGGPVLAWHAYRQPLPLNAIRAALAATFLLGNATRSAAVAASGALTAPTLMLYALGLPAVLACAWLGRRFPPPLSERAMRRAASLLIAAMGGFVAFAAAVALLA